MNGTGLVAPSEIGDWIPVAPLFGGRPVCWNGLDLTAQSHSPWSGEVPPLSCHLITAFQAPGRIRRRSGGRWQQEQVSAGTVTLIPRARGSQWAWDDRMDAIHLHVSDQFFSRIAQEVFGADGKDHALIERLKIDDPVIASTLGLLASEAQSGGPAEHLYVDAVTTHLCVHVLRHYSELQLHAPRKAGRLSWHGANQVADHIDANLAEPLTIQDLADVAKTSPFHFSRVFRDRFGSTPHRYVMGRRLQAARERVLTTSAPLKQIAADCGFYDHAHMTRLFRAHFGETPGSLKRGH